MGNILTINFWFGLYPGALSATGIKFYLFSILFFVFLSVVIKFILLKTKEKLHRRLYRKVLSLSITNIVLLLFLFFLMFETVPFLSSRFWILILALINLIWIYFILKFYKTIPSQKKEIELEKEFTKYLP